MLKTLKNLNQTQRITLIVLSAALMGCLAMMAVTPARSALTYFSPEYEAEIAQTHIGVALTENGTENVNIRSGVGDLKLDKVAEEIAEQDAETEGTSLIPGKAYTELLSVKNISEDVATAEGTAAEGMPEYVRLTVRKYWSEGESADSATKKPSLDPSLIELVFDEKSAECWVRSEAECTPEREVFYYKTVLAPGEAAAQPAVTAIRVSDRIKNTVESYASCWLTLDAQVDSVQVNNAVAAAKSAWGIDVTQFADEGLDWSGEE